MTLPSDVDFLNASPLDRSRLLAQLAHEVVGILNRWPAAAGPAQASLDLVDAYLRNGLSAEDVSLYLNHPDPNQDLSALEDFVDKDPDACAALDIVIYATAAVSAIAYAEVDPTGARTPDPIQNVTPTILLDGLIKYRELTRRRDRP